MSAGRSSWLALFGAIAIALPSLAHGSEPSAPRATYRGKPVDVAITVSGYGQTPDQANPPMRLPQPLAKPFEWFGEDSALAQAHIARPQALGFAKLVLDIDAGGAVSGCRATDTMELPVDVAAVCSDLASQKFLPALDPEGKRIAGGYIVTFSPRRFDAADVSQAHPLFTGERDPTPVPTMAPRVDSLYSFPPSPSWMGSFYSAPQWQHAPHAGLPKNAAGDAPPMTAIVLFDKGSGLDCRVIERSGVRAEDDAACGYARSVLKPVWADASASNHRGIPLYVGAEGDATVAYAPDPDYRRTTTMGDATERRFVTALTNAGVFPDGREASPLRIGLSPDPQGKVARCRIWVSTGSDAGDVAACRAARETVVMEPMEDIFGRVPDYAGLVWVAASTDR